MQQKADNKNGRNDDALLRCAYNVRMSDICDRCGLGEWERKKEKKKSPENFNVFFMFDKQTFTVHNNNDINNADTNRSAV